LGNSRKDPKIEIKKLNTLKCTGRSTKEFFQNISIGINALRQIGVTKEQFGAREHCDVLISGLNNEFQMLQTTLYTEFDRCTWSQTDQLDPESIMQSIELFKSRLQIQAPNRSPRTHQPNPRHSRPQNNNPPSQAVTTPCSFCIAMGGNAAAKAGTHLIGDCGYKKRADRANSVVLAAKDGNKSDPQYFILDSGATQHMSPTSSILCDYTPFNPPRKVFLGDDNTINALGKGTMIMKSTIDGHIQYLPFFNTLHVPKLSNGLISVPILMKQGTQMDWNNPNTVQIFHKGQLSMVATLTKNNLLRIDGTPLSLSQEATHILSKFQSDFASVASYSSSGPNQFLLWHRRLGHPSKVTLTKTVPLVNGINLGSAKSMPPCESCDVANAQRAKHPTSSSKTNTAGALPHIDHGIFTTPTILGETGYLIIGDDHDHWVDLEPVKNLTSQTTLEKFKIIEARNKTQFNRKPVMNKRIRTDDHGTFQGEFQNYLNTKGIKHELTVRYEHEQAGWIERMNQTIGRKHRSQMTFSDVPMEFAG
jgi:hypothetical protein